MPTRGCFGFAFRVSMITIGLCAIALLTGCLGRNFDAGSGGELITDPLAPIGSPGVTAPTVESAQLAQRLDEILANLLATRPQRVSRRAAVRPASLPIGLPVGLPNLQQALISLTPGLSPVLQGLANGANLQTIPDVRAFMTQYGLSSTTLALAISQARAVMIDLQQFSVQNASGNPLIAAALEQAVPLVFENPGALADHLGGYGTAAGRAPAQVMAVAIGLGLEAQLVVAVAATDSATLQLITLGSDGLSEAINATADWENGPPTDALLTTTENASSTVTPTVALSGRMAESVNATDEAAAVEEVAIGVPAGGALPGSDSVCNGSIRPDTFDDGVWRDDADDRYYSLEATGRPASGELPPERFRAWRLEPYESVTWYPSAGGNKRFRNNISYEVQLYNPPRSQPFLRIFTLGGFEIVNDRLDHDTSERRGYFQHYHEIRFEPIDDAGQPIRLSDLENRGVFPAQVLTDINGVGPGYVTQSSLDGRGSYIRRERHTAIPGFEINSEREIGARWSFALRQAKRPVLHRENMDSEAHWFFGGGDLVWIDGWRDMFWVRSFASDNINVPPPHAWDDLRPACHALFCWWGERVPQRFRFSNTQGVRTVWRSTGGGFRHDEAFSRKFRTLSVDFGAVVRDP